MKLAICILVHHNPWLMMSSLISLAMQRNTDYDLHVINIKGTGECRDRESYKEFYKIADESNESMANGQLTSDDNRIIDIVNSLKIDYTYHEFENDHGLDSGAWYRFIKKGVWKSYDYSFFLEEGFIFTRETVLDSLNTFISNNKLDFLDMGFGKRMCHKSQIEKVFSRGVSPSKLDIFKDEAMKQVYHDFSQDQKFKELYDKWEAEPFLNKNPIGTTFYHVPSSAYSFSEKIKMNLKSLLKHNEINSLFSRLILQQPQARLRMLSKITDEFKIINKVVYHKEKSPYFFGTYCQHFFSKEFLSSFENKLDIHNLYKVLEYPISAGPLEPIWGILPSWLGFDKWYFDGVHRISKNFITLKREDDVNGVCKYINRYYKGKIKVEPDGDFVKIIKCKYKYKYIRNLLGDLFYANNFK